jgi:glycerol-3-phosphate dehydrogenase (NAD(P)+)
MNVTVLGAGAWGTALAKVLADKHHRTILWSHRQEVSDHINEHRVNARYLPGAVLPAALRATHDLEEALHGAEMVVVVIPSHGLRAVIRDARPHIPAGALLCSASKGIENDSLMLMSDILLDELGRSVQHRLTYLSGPSFAKEVALRMPTTVVIAGTSERETEAVQHHFATDMFRTYASPDVTGVEIGGALKNVIAIAAGVADGLGYGHNTRAGLITRGLAEIGRLAGRKGANPLTLAGLAGMGDLVLTCTGDLSRNRTVGIELGKGRKLRDILATLGHVAEGVKTTQSAFDLSNKLGVDMPITGEVYRILYEDKPPQQAVVDLMTRALTKE